MAKKLVIDATLKGNIKIALSRVAKKDVTIAEVFSAAAENRILDTEQIVWDKGVQAVFPENKEDFFDCLSISELNGRKIIVMALPTPTNGVKVLYLSSLRKRVPVYDNNAIRLDSVPAVTAEKNSFHTALDGCATDKDVLDYLVNNCLGKTIECVKVQEVQTAAYTNGIVTGTRKTKVCTFNVQ